jgi:hypothetical protein
MGWIGQMAKGKYREWLQGDNLILLKGWARDGLSDEQIAHNMGIAPKTLWEWKAKYSEISSALKKTKEIVDKEVENALYKSAMGYDYEEITEQRRYNKATGEYEMVVVEKKIKHQPPNTASIIFWLKNRKPEIWRDKQEITNTEALEKLDSILGELKNEADREAE